MVIALAAIISGHAVLRGDKPEQFCAAIIILGIAADRAIDALMGGRSFDSFDLSRLLLDALQFVLFLIIALRANRIYPLAICAAQLLALIGSIAVLAVSNGWNQAYWAMTQLPLFLQLAFLAGGTFAHHSRVSQVGNYNCWSPRLGSQSH